MKTCNLKTHMILDTPNRLLRHIAYTIWFITSPSMANSLSLADSEIL